MINYIPAAQLTLEGFTHPFGHALNPENRWVRLAQLIPWDELARIYARKLRTDAGRETVNIRMVIGALIVKHKMGLSDRDTVQQIAENVYIQYFCGLSGFQTARPFDPSLLVSIRKRMGAGVFDAFNDQIIAAAEEHKPPRKQRGRRPGGPGEGTDCGGGSGETTPEGGSIASATKNKGVLKVDATIADQQIKYPHRPVVA